MVVTEPGTPGKPVFTGMVKEAHAAGLKVHPYTFRQDEGADPGLCERLHRPAQHLPLPGRCGRGIQRLPDKAVEAIKAHGK